MKQAYLYKYGLAILALLFSINVFAQSNTFKGKIVDERNLPLPGVSIKVKETNQGITTGNDGNFQFTSAGKGPLTLTISYVGYDPIEKTILADLAITVALVPNAKSLSEVVVVGYGTVKKSDLTGAVSTISSKDLNPGSITNPLQQLTGKAAGVNISQTGSEPGTSPSVRIRGITSLIGGNDPLVVIDGVQGNMDLLTQVPPSEIESVDVLKDASATAIYGSRGAPGVIIITTKKNRAGKSSVEYTANASVDVLPKGIKLLDADQWWQQAQLYSVPASANHGSSTDWYNLLTQTGVTQNHTIAFGGGANSFNYRASLSAILQTGSVIKSNYKNYIGRIQATQKAFDDKLTLTMNLNNGINNTNYSPTGVGRESFRSNLISNTYVTRPTDPVYNTDGSYYSDPNVFQYVNPYAVANTVVNENHINSLFGSLRADLQLYKGLSLGWFGSWRKVDGNSGYYLPASSTVSSAIDNQGIANINNYHNDEKLMDISLNYKVNFGDHNLDAVAVYETQGQTYNGNFAQAKGFINDIATYNALQLGDLSKVTPGDMSSYKNDRNLVSFLGRVNYSYKNRYLITASYRRDGSSVFGVNHKWGDFPSASIAWKIDEESFMKDQKIFTSLKLRGGFGITGNQQGLSPQGSLQLVGYSGVTYFGGAPITNFVVSQNANPDLRWETRKQTNIGLDFGLLGGRISGTIDAFTATTDNLLFGYTVPQPPFPYPNITANVGSLENKGLELTLSYDVIKTENTVLTLAGNGSLLKNKVLSLSGSIAGVPLNTNYVSWGINSYLIEGMPIGTFNILQHKGKDAANAETVVDQNGDGIIDQGNQSPDRVIAGSAIPKYTYAFTPSFRYKNFDASMVWRGSGGNKIYNTLRPSLSYFESLGKSNVLESAIPLGLYTSQYSSDLWLENGAYLRWENLSFGYTVKTEKIKYVSSLRLSLTGSNLLLITKYTGIDPELNVSGGSGSGSDGGIYPRTRTFSLGLNVVFK
ncbi:SusC/RagA family TonB-linked outer membrane protein [Pedobacter frigidisoli]|uniref:SusC/RagA family TonB-linked outer membrane protein n=1 Tax=Pedobacter frigidisoli TaxID=2530455 RepID=A0A4R0P3S4_9SPHI|nr:SusC/RagA family TonB-linked outer membrane protein [Pedobacter frigidisoli]TCD08300.1 SusC/RagA family TonB-linked outer membrane protein [Pedobacter frigidisoli]